MINPQLFKKIIIVLISLIVVTAAVGVFYYERNIFSSERLRFEITAPDKATAGEEVDYILRYRNNSDTRLEEVVLIFEYPEGALAVDGEDEEGGVIKRGDFRREVKVGELNPGEEKITTFKAVLIGKENDTLEALAWIRYVPRNLAARFDSKRSHVTQIASVPIKFDLQIPATVTPGSEESVRVRFSSEVDYPLSNLEVRLSYPSGFRFTRSVPEAEMRERNRWQWPVLNQGESATINIEGVFRGDPGTSQIFTAMLGVVVGDRFVTLKEVTRGTSVARSNIIIRAQVNGQEEYRATPGELLHYEIGFLNIGQEVIENLYLLVELDKEKLDLSTVESVNGRFQEDAGSIVWSNAFDYEMESLSPGEGGRVQFWVNVKSEFSGDPFIIVKASIERAIKVIETPVGSAVSFEQNIVREANAFGPVPFMEGERSTYTVNWRASNDGGEVEDLFISTALPRGAKPTGERSGQERKFSFNSMNQEVTVELESVSRGEDVDFSFEVEITPEEDFGTNTPILYETEMIAVEKATGEPVRRVLLSVPMKIITN